MTRLSDFDYPLETSFIAQNPLDPRDQARLLVFHRKTGQMEHRHFCDLGEYLKPDDVLIINDTQVLAARLLGRKEKTGGKVELLLTHPISDDTWNALISSGLKKGQRILFEDGSGGELVRIADRGQVHIRFQPKPDFSKWLDEIGKTPLPPYIKRFQKNGGQAKTDRRAYQTVYAKFPGSVAAPTAGLHFTESLLNRIREIGVQILPVTLHIGPGTFRPVRVSEIEEHSMDPEFVCVPAETAAAIHQAKCTGNKVIAVGTTAVRGLEAAARADSLPHPMVGMTDLFITPGYRFRVIDALITNFHLPCSTLLMLVSAFAGREAILAAYQEAIQERYRFYSFGDAMFIL